MTSVAQRPDARERPLWKQVALPAEHGGWGLTLEPVALGLLLAASWAGVALGAAAFAAFLLRTPLKLALVDRRRSQWQARSRLAMQIALAELVVLAACAAGAFSLAGAPWLVMVVLASPLVAVELWFDVHSRGRRLAPELCGAAGIAATAAAIVVAGGRSSVFAAGAWLVLVARSVGAIPFVRAQIVRLRRNVDDGGRSDVAQAVAAAMAAGAVALDHRLLVGGACVTALAVAQLWWVRRPPTAAKVLGIRQMGLGAGLVLATAIGVWMS